MMNRSSRLFCFGLLILVLVFSIGLLAPSLAASQPRARGAQVLGWHNFFPLAAGNRWVYDVKGPGSASRTWEVKVKSERSLVPFRPYYELSGYFPGKDPRLVHTTIVGAVWERGDDGKDYLWYEFAARVGRTWIMNLAPGDSPTCEDGASLRIGARDEVITVPAGEFKQVIRIDFMTKCTDAGITREWFAPGVGLIRREETSIAGPVVSELVYAEVSGRVLPSSVYSTTLQLSASRYTYNLMPPVDSSKLPRVNGAFIVRDGTGEEPGVLVFPSSCIGLQLEVRNQAGEVVLQMNTGENIPCLAVVTKVDLGKEALVVPFSFKLADTDGNPLPDGAYSLTAVLLTSAGDDTLRPAARALIDVKSAH
jgi:hypothetical protein